MRRFLNKHLISIAIYTVSALILLSVSLSFYNKKVMSDALETQEQADMVVRVSENTLLNIRQMDISARGYALIREEGFLFWSVANARKENRENFKALDSLFAIQGYSDPVNYPKLKAGFKKYADMYEEMVQHLKNDDLEAYKAILKDDYGRTFWPINDAFTSRLYEFEDELVAKAQARYETAIFQNTIVQLLLLLIGLPTLIFITIKLRRDEKNRTGLLINLRENNKKYLFNDGDNQFRGAAKILNGSIENLKKAANYVRKVASGEFDVEWTGMTEENKDLNQKNLAGQLIEMKKQMQLADIDNKKRIWSTEGLSKLTEIIRNSEQDTKQLTFEATKYLTQYLGAQQGSLFILVQDEEDTKQKHLELSAAYAFDRQKFIKKKLEIGQGLVGQTYRERETLLLTEIPQDYTIIKSGLGDSTPTCLAIVPMMYNDNVQSLIELASFRKFEEHEVKFLEKAGEYVASAIATTQNNEKTRILLEQMQQQAEEMRAQEEELRQNMEELEATQEEMRRKEKMMEEKMQNADSIN
ncbi:GAF domain-containing protein [Marivirga harenae]|uniref:GAF domain-containing protein n=1 Tax=Marivirga harenae TaxID=2010992 RepID=UPI0026E02D6A|nr:GAF domain-containing protein [Marivirga harenae]WKV11564.1 GAF domain-containing protein [Marivirga harenae]|tara:strand:+ start:55793 stop:57376 length:1584 start_codon:yes stop_codon:yes gene_type:complete